MTKRHVVIMNGVGGQGVLVAGELLVKSAVRAYSFALYSPLYGSARRGGFSECVVSFSNDEVASPWISKADTVVVFEASKILSCEGKVLPGGTLITETTGLKDSLKRTDIKVVKVPAIQSALDMGSGKVNNIIMLGACVKVSNSIDPKIVEEEIAKGFGQKFLEDNLKAFREGMRLASVGYV